MNLDTLHAFEANVASAVPGFRVAYKDKTWWMAWLGFLVRPFNPDFLSRYTTTLGTTVYFPDQETYEANPKSSFTILAHEMVHLLDGQAHPWTFKLSYLFPQVLSVPALVAYVALRGLSAWPLGLFLLALVVAGAVGKWRPGPLSAGVAITGAVGALVAALVTQGLAAWPLVLALLCLAPWPAPWRVQWERRGYAMNLCVTHWSLGFLPQVYLDGVGYYFYGPPYYFMSWDKKGTSSWSTGVASSLRAGTWDEAPYLRVRTFLIERGEIGG